ncbi:unnamed protein product [Strongylus vulgaris]|uniref:Uncharacterized protein n=1 Tax=Strongylus vulgaris TaxID=40348 RepID=A0A3P7KBV8_STRVU|nr:unnamed protein product [Strongylus vulgaris]
MWRGENSWRGCTHTQLARPVGFWIEFSVPRVKHDENRRSLWPSRSHYRRPSSSGWSAGPAHVCGTAAADLDERSCDVSHY